MTILNLTPVLDALTGTAVTAASFKAVAMRAGRTAVRVDGATVTFPTELTATWDGVGWDVTPTLYPLPVDCYWKVRVAAAGGRLERNVVLPNGDAAVAFGDLIAVTPDTGQVDTSTISQFQATQQFVSNQVRRSVRRGDDLQHGRDGAGTDRHRHPSRRRGRSGCAAAEAAQTARRTS
jgi:hypothetical protein